MSSNTRTTSKGGKGSKGDKAHKIDKSDTGILQLLCSFTLMSL